MRDRNTTAVDVATCDRCRAKVQQFIFAFDTKKDRFDTLCCDCWMESRQHEHREQNGLQKLLDIDKELKPKKIKLN